MNLDINAEVRLLGYLSAVIAGQKADPLCPDCRAYSSTTGKARERLAAIKAQGKVPEGFSGRLGEIEACLEGIALPAEPVPQRKLGRCKLPGAKCMLKHSLAMFEAGEADNRKEGV